MFLPSALNVFLFSIGPQPLLPTTLGSFTTVPLDSTTSYSTVTPSSLSSKSLRYKISWVIFFVNNLKPVSNLELRYINLAELAARASYLVICASTSFLIVALVLTKVVFPFYATLRGQLTLVTLLPCLASSLQWHVCLVSHQTQTLCMSKTYVLCWKSIQQSIFYQVICSIHRCIRFYQFY